MNKILLSCLLVIAVISAYGQQWPKPELPDTSSYGKYTSRTMHLLESSTPETPNTVKILVYGQSISAQDWWIPVKESIKTRYPSANLIMENKSIGGFASQLLCKTVEMDVSAFYPDMVLLHIYGSNQMYDSVLYTIRSRTAAEVAIQTDHYTGENKWSDTMSYYFLSQMAEKYKCDLINIRDPWKQYLSDNHLQPKDLLKDEVHLNKHGEFVMAELIKPLFQYKSKYPADPFGLCTVMTAGKDFKVRKGQVKIPFTGNRVDVVCNSSGATGKAQVLVDNQRPSAFQGTWYMGRPYGKGDKSWPWSLPAMIHVGHQKPWIAEEWTLQYTQATAPYDDFSFEISGSVTGPDGSGKASEDFVSLSKRVIIHKGDADDGGDWHLSRSYKVLKTTVQEGDQVKWKTYSASVDTLVKTSDNKPLILFQGVPNTRHTLQIISAEKTKLPIQQIIVYRPFYKK
ncbi:MAG: SGNH/GDSL hydrolase family protein [Candidatus Saccharibacteria bacterium]